MKKIHFVWILLASVVVLFSLLSVLVYELCKVDVPAMHVAVLTKKTGKDLDNSQVVAPDGDHKGLQLAVLNEGRYFYNPLLWDWEIYPMIEIPAGKLGVRVRVYGENLPYGHFLATKENQKGVVPEVLRPGRYAINAIVKGQNRQKSDYVEIIELYDPVEIPAGYRGVVTNLAGPISDNPNVFLVEKGYRGVQKETLDAGTYYLNPYLYKVSIVDCRSQRFNLAEESDMGFPSKDGFWVTLDGIVEFRINPEKCAEIFVLYNENLNDNSSMCEINEEIIRKVVMPNARSFCRSQGANSKGRDFIGGETRTAFQKDFHKAMKHACSSQGIEIEQALITKINPPQAIAKPVREREVANQLMGQFREQKLQQDAEAQLAIEKALIVQKRELIQAEQEVVKSVTLAQQKQKVAITKAKEDKAVAQRDLEAAKDQAEATMSKLKAEATIIDLQNIADASGWKKAIDSMKGDGNSYARYTMYQKLSPNYKQLTVNTGDSPLMDVFRQFSQPKKEK